MIDVFAVRRIEKDGSFTVVAAYMDEYDAKHWAMRWEEAEKVEHDWIPATLILAR